jgi:predicted dehydrogenase
MALRRPKLGFAGVGWIGRNRLAAISNSQLADIVAIYDPQQELASSVVAEHGGRLAETFSDLLARDIDGLVIATPSALHATQATAALEAGKAVFCQKPLARSGEETRTVVDAARRADRLLGVDFSYRFTEGMKRIRSLITRGELGDVYAVETKFHNAYGPDKPWFFDRALSGGGCLLDLGIHLVDLALWSLGTDRVVSASGVLHTRGTRWTPAARTVEDYAAAQFVTGSGAAVQLSCSWNAPAGTDAIIEAAFYGTRGGALFKNRGGSFYDFTAEHLLPDRSRRVLAEPPDNWGGGAALAWVDQLAHDPRFDPSIQTAVTTAHTLDRIYASASQS